MSYGPPRDRLVATFVSARLRHTTIFAREYTQVPRWCQTRLTLHLRWGTRTGIILHAIPSAGITRGPVAQLDRAAVS